jgi:outer membrane cobalamin receptor
LQTSIARADLLFLAMGVVATAPVVAAGDAAQQLETVLVTGSNIPRPGSIAASPVQVLTAGDLEKTGYTTVWQALQMSRRTGRVRCPRTSVGRGRWAPAGCRCVV